MSEEKSKAILRLKELEEQTEGEDFSLDVHTVLVFCLPRSTLAWGYLISLQKCSIWPR
jgi:hypothetical protein